MRVTIPVNITELQLVSSNAAEPHDPPAYNAGTTYNFGDIVKVAADFKIYESIQTAHVGKTPKTSPLYWRAIGVTEQPYNPATSYGIGETVSSNHRCYEKLTASSSGNPLPVLPDTETDHWFDVGPTNKYAALDLNCNTQTVIASPLTLVIAPGQRISTLGLLGLEANEAVVSATSVTGKGVVYPSRTIDLNTRQVFNADDYAFEPFSTQPSFVLFDLPPFSDMIVTITLTSTSGNVKCGSVVLGTSTYLGTLNLGAVNSEKNFPTITRDKYGVATFKPSRSIPANSHEVTIESWRANKIRAVRKKINGIVALWTGLDEFESDWFDAFATLGPATRFDLIPGEGDHGTIRLDIEEI